MSHFLTPQELENWKAFRDREAMENRGELFAPLPKDIQLSEIKVRLQKIIGSSDAQTGWLNELREIVREIERAEKRSGGGNDG